MLKSRLFFYGGLFQVPTDESSLQGVSIGYRKRFVMCYIFHCPKRKKYVIYHLSVSLLAGFSRNCCILLYGKFLGKYFKPSNYVDHTNAKSRPKKCVKISFNKSRRKRNDDGLKMKKLKMTNIVKWFLYKSNNSPLKRERERVHEHK